MYVWGARHVCMLLHACVVCECDMHVGGGACGEREEWTGTKDPLRPLCTCVPSPRSLGPPLGDRRLPEPGAWPMSLAAGTGEEDELGLCGPILGPPPCGCIPMGIATSPRAQCGGCCCGPQRPGLAWPGLLPRMPASLQWPGGGGPLLADARAGGAGQSLRTWGRGDQPTWLGPPRRRGEGGSQAAVTLRGSHTSFAQAAVAWPRVSRAAVPDGQGPGQAPLPRASHRLGPIPQTPGSSGALDPNSCPSPEARIPSASSSGPPASPAVLPVLTSSKEPGPCLPGLSHADPSLARFCSTPCCPGSLLLILRLGLFMYLRFILFYFIF